MSYSINECDSDEEVFWGPVTARELELLWRSRMASGTKRLESGSKPFSENSSEKRCGVSNDLAKTVPLREVPSLFNLKKLNRGVKVLENYDALANLNPEQEDELVEEFVLPLSEDNILITQNHERVQNIKVEKDICHIVKHKMVVNYEVKENSQHSEIIKPKDDTVTKRIVQKESCISQNSESDPITGSLNNQSKDKNAQMSSIQNKENKCPSQKHSENITKTPVKNINKSVLKPATLLNGNVSGDLNWANNLKTKNIPKPKKPEYMVSPAKLGNVLKSISQSSPNLSKNALGTSRLKMEMSTPKRTITVPISKSKSVSCIPKKKPAHILSSATPNKNQYDNVKSPVAQYIKTRKGLTPDHLHLPYIPVYKRTGTSPNKSQKSN